MTNPITVVPGARDSYALMVTSEHVFVSALFQRDLRSLKDIRAGRVSWNVPSEAWANDASRYR